MECEFVKKGHELILTGGLRSQIELAIGKLIDGNKKNN